MDLVKFKLHFIGITKARVKKILQMTKQDQINIAYFVLYI